MTTDRLPKILGITRFAPTHGEWRLGTPLRAVGEAGLAITETVGLSDLATMGDEGQEMLVDMAFSSDLVIMQTPHNRHSLPFVEGLVNAGIKVAIDHDDHPFIIDPTNEAYRTWGRRECQVLLNGRVVRTWEDCGDCEDCQKHHKHEGPSTECFNIKRNKWVRRNWFSCIKAADAMIVTNKRLGKAFRRYKSWKHDKPIHVIPNMLEMRRWGRITRVVRPSIVGRTVRIGWHGGASHHADLLYVRPALKAICEKYPQVKLSFYGYISPDVLEDIPNEKIELHQWDGGIGSFLTRLKSNQIDIGIAPVRPTEFASTKSEIKWIEYASQGIPVVATACEPYSSSINFTPGDDPNWTGLLALSTEEWVAALSFLIENEAARQGIGENAYDVVTERYDAAKRAEDIMAVYQRILDGDDISRSLSGAREVVRSGSSVDGAPD